MVKRWTEIELDFGEEETINFGKRQEFAAPDSLYHLQTLATIAAQGDDEQDKENQENDVRKDVTENIPTFSSVTDGQVIAMSVECDLSIFAIEPFQLNHLFSFESTIDALCFLPHAPIVVVGLAGGEFVFVSTKYNRIFFRKSLSKSNFSSGSRLVALRSFDFNYVCFLFALIRNGPLLVLRLDNYTKMITAIEQNNLSLLKTLTPSLRFDRLPVEGENCMWTDLAMLSPIQAALLVSNNSSPLLYLSHLRVPIFDMIDENHVYKKVEVSSDGRFGFFLNSNGVITLWDMWTLLELCHLPIFGVTDFIILDVNPDISGLSGKQILLLRQDSKDDTAAVAEILSLPNCQLIYSVKVDANSNLVKTSFGHDGSLFVTEFVCNDNNNGLLRLRSIVEAQPETRLHRLLNKRQFSEAEAFAVQFGLDVQLVYKTEMNVLLSNLQSQETPSLEDFGRLQQCFSQLKDSSTFVEACISAAALLPRSDWISSVLIVAETRLRKGREDELLFKILSVQYKFITFKLVFGPNASFDRDSQWPSFLSNKSWLLVIQKFIKDGLIIESTVIWVRNEREIRNELKKSNGYQDFLESVTTAVQQGLCSPDSAFNFAENHFIPAILYDDPCETASLVANWLLNLCQWLEVGHPLQWPANALYLSEMVKRIVEKWWNSDQSVGNIVSTKGQQAQAAYVCCILMPNCTSSDYPMGRLNVMIRNLNDLNRLHQVYKCRLTYDQFVVETRESICYRILDRTQAVEILKDSVEQYARPYMKEKGLDDDATLHNYIMDLSTHSMHSAGGGTFEATLWEDRAVTIIECIGSLEFQCRSVIAVAKGAKLPWSSAVDQLVQKTLQYEIPVVNELRAHCRYAQLRQVLSKYPISGQALAVCSSSRGHFQRTIRYVLKQKQSTRLEDALAAAKLNDWLTESDVYVLYLSQVMENNELQSAITVLSSLDPIQASSYSSRLIERCKIKSGFQYPNTQESVTFREQLLEGAISIGTRFLIIHNSDGTIADTLNQFRMMLRLQQEFSQMITWQQWLDDSFKLSLMKNFVLEHLSQPEALSQYRRLSYLLGFDRIDAAIVAAKSLMTTDQPMIVMEVMKKLINKDDLNSTNVVQIWQILCAVVDGLDNQSSTAASSCFVSLCHYLSCLTGHLPLELMPKFLNVLAFCQLSRLVLRQCDATVESIKTDDHHLITGLERKQTDYKLENDGLLLDSKIIVPILTRTVRCLLIHLGLSRIENEETDDVWSELSNQLQLHEQHYLEMLFRLFRLNLFGCTKDDLNALSVAAADVFEQVTTKSVNNDYFLSLTVFSILPDHEAYNLVKTLNKRLINSHQRSLSTVINVAEAMALLEGEASVVRRLRSLRTDVMWSGRLAKWNIPYSLGAGSQQRIELVTKFAEKLIPIDLLLSYCKGFDLDINDCFSTYLAGLLSSSENDNEKVINLAEGAFGYLSLTSNIVIDRLKNLLVDLDPYAYERIEFLLTKMARNQITSGIDKLIRLLQFLSVYNRRSKPSSAERDWYSQRLTDQSSLDSTVVSPNDTFDFRKDGKRPNVPMSVIMPKESATFLPFHAFLPKQDGQSDDVLSSILENEVCLDNVEIWHNFAESSSPVRLSRTQMVELAVQNAVKVVGHSVPNASGLAVDLRTLQQIGELLKRADKMIALKCCGWLIKRMAMGESKLRAVEMGVNISEEWVKEETDKSGTAEKYCDTFVRAKESLGTEFFLKRFGFLNAETSNLVSTPARLIFHLCETFIPNKNEIEQKLGQFMVKLKMLRPTLDICKIQQALIDKCLPPNMKEVASDHNETTLIDLNCDIISKTTILPLMESNLSRVVFLLRQRELRQAACSLVSIIFNEKDSSEPNDVLLKIRALCCLLRLLTPAQIQNLLPFTLEQLRERLTSLSYLVILQKVNLSTYTWKSFEAANKQAMLNALWHNRTNNSSLVAELLTNLIVDFNLECNKTMVETTLQRLLSTDGSCIAQQLLIICQQTQSLWVIPSLPLLWSKYIQAILSRCRTPLDSKMTEICRLAYFFLARCPKLSEASSVSLCQSFTDLQLNLLGQLVLILALERKSSVLQIKSGQLSRSGVNFKWIEE